MINYMINFIEKCTRLEKNPTYVAHGHTGEIRSFTIPTNNNKELQTVEKKKRTMLYHLKKDADNETSPTPELETSLK